MNLFFAWLSCLAGVTACVKLSLLAGDHFMGPFNARKLCHLCSGTCFVCFWTLFPDSSLASAAVASSVVALATIKFLLAGLDILPDAQLTDTVGAGDRRNLLQGPCQYGLAICIITLAAFRQPAAVVAIGVICGGDACAAMFGRALGRMPVPCNRQKTVEGMVAFVAASFGVTAILLQICQRDFQNLPEHLQGSQQSYVLCNAVASVFGAVAEVLPFAGANYDNVAVPVTAFTVSRLLC